MSTNLSGDERLFQTFDDEREISQQAKDVAINFLLSIEGVEIKKDGGGCLKIKVYSKSLPEDSIRTSTDKEILIRVNLIVTMRKSINTNSYDFDLREGICNGITICHGVEDVRWWVLIDKNLSEEYSRGVLTIPYNSKNRIFTIPCYTNDGIKILLSGMSK
jgi:hypothetical protein